MVYSYIGILDQAAGVQFDDGSHAEPQSGGGGEGGSAMIQDQAERSEQIGIIS